MAMIGGRAGPSVTVPDRDERVPARREVKCDRWDVRVCRRGERSYMDGRNGVGSNGMGSTAAEENVK